MSNRKAMKRIGRRSKSKPEPKEKELFFVEVDWHNSEDWYQRDNAASGSLAFCKGWAECWHSLFPDMPVRVVKAIDDDIRPLEVDSVLLTYCGTA